MDKDWYGQGRSGGSAPIPDDDPYGWKQLRYSDGLEQQKRDRAIDYMLTHPNDPFGHDDPFKRF